VVDTIRVTVAEAVVVDTTMVVVVIVIVNGTAIEIEIEIVVVMEILGCYPRETVGRAAVWIHVLHGKTATRTFARTSRRRTALFWSCWRSSTGPWISEISGDPTTRRCGLGLRTASGARR
jgi:hypothetical protein